MKKFVCFLLLLLLLSGCKRKQAEKERLCTRIDSSVILSMFPQSVGHIMALVSQSKELVSHMIQMISMSLVEQKTFSMTIRAYDSAHLQYMINKNLLTILANLSVQSEIQKMAYEQKKILDQYEIDVIERNELLYRMFKEFGEKIPDQCRKESVAFQFIKKMVQQYEQNGLALSFEQRNKLFLLKRDEELLMQQYYENIEKDQCFLAASFQELFGVSEEFLKTLSRNEQGDFLLPFDQKTFAEIMQYCLVEKTRKNYFLCFKQRAYPQNNSVLALLLQKRQGIAEMMGVKNFALYELSNQMVKNPKYAECFLWAIVYGLQKYDNLNFVKHIKDLPPSVELTVDHKIKPWDELLIKADYKKQHGYISDQDVSCYFELENTLKQMFSFFEKLFYLEFKKEESNSDFLWAPDVICYQVYSLKNQSIVGYLFLDLYQHSYKKIKEPTFFRLIPAIKDDCSICCSGASVVAACFTQSTLQQPSLLTFRDLSALFHQFGHALHELLGASCFADFSGTSVVKDFREVPAYVFECLIEQEEVLKAISRHYKTGLPMSSDMIKKILCLRRYDRVYEMLQKSFWGLVALSIHQDESENNVHKKIEDVYKKVFKHIDYEEAFFDECNSYELVNDKALAYADVWAYVIASDLFTMLKDYEMKGERGWDYVKNILQPGGFRSPLQMIKKFLNRPFQTKAFFNQIKDIGSF
ncbi:hypothetical protein HYV11_01630 [Candidatus Dependentiae bacterium]|nr:hypothetical protein [Candidatus Dependentiae bacterium]